MNKTITLTISIILATALSSFSQQMTDVNIQILPANHALNAPIDQLPVHLYSDDYIKSIGYDRHLHPDFGTEWDDSPIGIPYNVVGAGQPMVPVTFVSWPDESDPGPYPVPQNPYIEGVYNWSTVSNGDRHMMVVDTANYMLYEVGRAFGNAGGTSWEGSCGAVFDLQSNALRPDGWTSVDAAGLPIFPLLIRYDEVERAAQTGGEIPHAIRFTADTTQKAYVWPARHYASNYTQEKYTPMGMRFRLKSDFDISGFSPRIQAILRTFKKYGLIMSDNGSNWFIQGTHDDRWDDDELGELKSIEGNNFEAVDISAWLDHPDFDNNSAAVPGGALTGLNIQRNSHNLSGTLECFPNPAYESSITVTFYTDLPGKETIRILSLAGEILHEEYVISGESGIISCRISPDGLKQGIYLVQVQSQTVKLIVLQ